MASPPTLQGNPSLDELRGSIDSGQLCSSIPVQYQASSVGGSTTGPTLVGIPRPDITVTGSPSTASPQYDYHFRCLQHRLGSMFGGHNYWGDMVSTGNGASHQLSGTLSRISSSAMLSEERESNMTILFKLDNVTAVTFINRIGGTHSKLLCQLALALWE